MTQAAAVVIRMALASDKGQGVEARQREEQPADRRVRKKARRPQQHQALQLLKLEKEVEKEEKKKRSLQAAGRWC